MPIDFTATLTTLTSSWTTEKPRLVATSVIRRAVTAALSLRSELAWGAEVTMGFTLVVKRFVPGRNVLAQSRART